MITALVSTAIAGLLITSPALLPDDVSSPTPSASRTAPMVTADAAQGPIVTVPASIASDCSVNVTTQLNSWIAGVADGSVLSFGSDDCFRIEYTILLTDRHDLTFDGNGARFEARTTHAKSPKVDRPMITVMGGTNVTLREFTLKGTNPAPKFDVNREWISGIEFRGLVGGLLDGVTGTNLWGDFVSFSPDTRPDDDPHSQNITMRNSTGNIVGRAQVMCNGCEHILITNNTFIDTGYQVFNIEVEAPTWHADHVSYVNNTISGLVPLSVLVNAGIGDYVSNINFANNTMTSVPISCQAPIFVLDTEPVKSNFTITGNKLKTLGAAAHIEGVTGVSIQDNVVQLTWGGGCPEAGTAVRAARTTGVVKHNQFTDFQRVTVKGVPTPPGICGNRFNAPAFDRPIVCREDLGL